MSRKIAFQGEPGAFSHAAVHQLFPNDEALPCPSFEDTIAAVQQGRADFGVVPVENSLYGRITDIYHLLPASGLHIVAEHFLRIEMNLLGIPGATLKDIKAVQSLSVALGQCRRFIAEHGFRTISGADTAGSAREIAEALSSGQWTHDYPISVDEAQELGLPVTTDVPQQVYDLMVLYPQAAQRRPSVEYIPGPYTPRSPRSGRGGSPRESA